MTMPDPDEIVYDDEIVARCYDVWSFSDFNGDMPHPLTVMMYPAGFVDQMMAHHQGVRFYEDSERRARLQPGGFSDNNGNG